MEAAVESLGALERQVQFQVTTQEVDVAAQRELKRIQKTMRLAGFRPGKVPFKIVEEQHGGQVRYDALNNLLNEYFWKKAHELGYRVAGMPSLNVVDDDKNSGILSFNAVFEVYPEVVVGTLDQCHVKKPTLVVTEAEVNKTIDVLRKQRQVFTSCERPAAQGDRVTLDYSATVDGLPFQGGTGVDFSVDIGAKQVLPDFENGILGLAQGDAHDFQVQFPEDYFEESLRGKSADFSVTVKQVQMPVPPDLNAEFAQAVGVVSGDLNEMRADIQLNLEREVVKRIRTRLNNDVFEVLRASSPLPLPSALVSAEQKRLRDGLLQKYGQAIQSNTHQLPEDVFIEQAQKNVHVGLLLESIVRDNKLTVGVDDVRVYVEDLAQSYEDPAAVVSWYMADPQRMNDVGAVILENKVVDWVLSKVQVSDEPIEFDELMSNS